jgi:hypothetical protein
MAEVEHRTRIWETIAEEAAAESDLWASALLPAAERAHVAVFSPLAPAVLAVGLETIYEGYLMHYGRPRIFAAGDRDTRILLGDYLYAHGLVRVAEHGDTALVADLAELLSLCAQLRAEAGAGEPVADGVLWAATHALIGSPNGELAEAREALRDRGDARPLAALAARVAGEEPVERAGALHAERASV